MSIYLSASQYNAETLIKYAIQDLEDRYGINEAYPLTSELLVLYHELRKLPPLSQTKRNLRLVLIRPLTGPTEAA